MRREHESIVADVLDALARYSTENRGLFHITALAAKANLPHDRLRTYLEELAAMDLLTLGPVPALTDKGRQFLECYHAWVRVQQMYGLLPRGQMVPPDDGDSPAVSFKSPLTRSIPVDSNEVGIPPRNSESAAPSALI